ncbi:ATP-binding cassette domain-containing protein [bacterium]|nr:ATP-binding cassette domain-containing protein [bacterium]MDY4581795.1 ATP-binding cassette domain-containing protein [Candidatus Faecousia sp.]
MIEIKNVSKTFPSADGNVDALKDVTLSIPDGDIFGIIGMSGAGKSTLVRCINMLERPSSGTVEIDGCDLSTLSEDALRKVRREISMIFQGFHLLMQRTCLKNVCFPLELAGVKGPQARKRALELLDLVGLKEKANAYPAQLSGGQQQRVAIARALATDPKVLLCDEATSALDPTTTNSILELIRSINQRLGITVIIITHQMSVVEQVCKHVAILDNGTVAEQGEVTAVFAHPKSPAARRLVFPEASDGLLPALSGRRCIRVLFKGAQATEKPLIARMALEKGIAASIAYASTKSIGDRAYGSMLLTLDDSEEVVRTAIDFLTQTPDVAAQEVDFHV